MKSLDQAATLIQARWKGRSQRIRENKRIDAIVKVQALQRGRSVRRDFAKLKTFRRQQDAFERESKARRERIWQHQQELLYMESISPEKYDRLVMFRKRRSARLIQRRWKEYVASTIHFRSSSYLWGDEDEVYDDLCDLASDSSSNSAPGTLNTIQPEAFLTKKQQIHQRIQEKVRQWSEKNPWKVAVPANASKAVKSKARGDTYHKLSTDLAALRQRVQIHRDTVRRPRQESTPVGPLISQCERRLQSLMAPVTPLENDPNGPKHSVPKSRRDAAVAHHSAVVNSIGSCTKSWQMPIAGAIYDMRERPPPAWSMLGNDKVWSWPHSFTVETKTNENSPEEDEHLEQFMGAKQDLPPEAWALYACREASQIVSCMTANPLLMAALRQNIVASDEFGENFASRMETQAAHQVAEVAAQIQFNTQLRSVEQKTKPDEPPSDDSLLPDYGNLRRERMATSIQRRVRGILGRQVAAERRAELFVTIRGRAIRKGLCEECGDVAAVLECRECQECHHFCPACWVHVHSTRRRKQHVPIPMAIPPKQPSDTVQKNQAVELTHMPPSKLARPTPIKIDTGSNKPQPVLTSPPLVADALLFGGIDAPGNSSLT
ncbi:hypothetical protein AC1031_010975 [Aphanomyces cochlioides]|nr:hypothetical protein AC1031_010975 [Aphanomyces cochlioides]